MKIKVQKLTTGAVLIAAASAFLFCSGFTKASDYGNGENGYLKSATYYSDEWVIVFAEGKFEICDPYGIAVTYRVTDPVSVENMQDSGPLG